MRCGNPAAESPADYIASLSGWRRDRVVELRCAVQAAGADEVIKWGHLVYLANGPAFLIRAEEERILFGFWRGQRLLEIEPRLKPGGKYEMATLVLDATSVVDQEAAARLAVAAVSLNATLGNPTAAAKKT